MAKNKRKKNKNRKNADLFAMGKKKGMLSSLSGLLPSKGRDQFLIGAAVGATIAYVLCDEALRAKLIRSGVKLYGGLMGGVAEMKEQFADIKAEMDVEESQAS